jgi:hypothetical protein
MQVIQHQELASAQASITFSSIPQTYTDLYLVVSLRSTYDFGPATWWLSKIVFNANTSGYSTRNLQGNGSSASSDSDTAFYFRPNDTASTANTFGSASLYIPNYAGSSNKSISIDNVSEDNGSQAIAQLVAGLWSNTSAITSIVIEGVSGDLAQYSSATLYGITKGSDGIVTVS